MSSSLTPPPPPGSQIQHLSICPELLKSCYCDPKFRGGAIYFIAKLETLKRVYERKGKATIIVSSPPPLLFWITKTAFEDFLKCCICDPGIGGGGLTETFVHIFFLF